MVFLRQLLLNASLGKSLYCPYSKCVYSLRFDSTWTSSAWDPDKETLFSSKRTLSVKVLDLSEKDLHKEATNFS